MSARLETIELATVKDATRPEVAIGRSVEVQVPASTSNLGSGFDCCGLALKLYLSVRARVTTRWSRTCEVYTAGEGSENGDAPRGRRNLICRAMRFVAEREGVILPPLRIDVDNDIPFASGLGSSGAAIVAGITLCSALFDLELTNENILRYGTELEGHADNVAAALFGGLVINCIKEGGDVIAVKRFWPSEVKIIAVTPHISVETTHAREILSPQVTRADAVYNLQRVALFGAALEKQDYDLLWEAMRDRLHQEWRAQLVPGLAEALGLPRVPGLLGLALSGSGPTVVVLATENFDEISESIVECFHKHKVEATARLLEVDHLGLRTSMLAHEEQSGHRIEELKSHDHTITQNQKL
jgi:homoserine kinase